MKQKRSIFEMREKERLRQERQKTWMDRLWFQLKLWIAILLVLLLFAIAGVAV